MKLAVRPIRDSEHPLVLDSWTRHFDAPTRHYMRIGGESRIASWAWYEMHRDWVRARLPSMSVLVATLAGHDEPLGWVAVTMPDAQHPLVVHYAFVLKLARGKGVGRELMRVAHLLADGRPARYSHMTSDGRRLIDGMAREQTSSIAGEVAVT